MFEKDTLQHWVNKQNKWIAKLFLKNSGSYDSEGWKYIEKVV